MGSPRKSPAELRAEMLAILTNADRALSDGDIAEALGMRRTSTAVVRNELARVSRTVRRIESVTATYYEMIPEPAGNAELFRGWYNPATGVTAPRLGLDPKPELEAA